MNLAAEKIWLSIDNHLQLYIWILQTNDQDFTWVVHSNLVYDLSTYFWLIFTFDSF